MAALNIYTSAFSGGIIYKVAFDFWEKIDDNRTVVRFCTSWATTDEQLDELEAILVTITGH